MEPVWFYWVVSLSLPALSIAIGFIYRVLNARQDRTDARLDAFSAVSMADRRELAERQAAMTARQLEQFDRIMSELSQLRLEISALSVRK